MKFSTQIHSINVSNKQKKLMCINIVQLSLATIFLVSMISRLLNLVTEKFGNNFLSPQVYLSNLN